eukprot:gene3551-6286_t
MDFTGCLEPNIIVAPPSFPVMTLYDKEKPFLKLTNCSETKSTKTMPTLTKEFLIKEDALTLSSNVYTTILPKAEDPNKLLMPTPKLTTLTPMFSIQHQSGIKSGHWSDAEHQLFLKGYEKYGRQWSKIAREFVRTRTRVQVISHAQQYFK